MKKKPLTTAAHRRRNFDLVVRAYPRWAVFSQAGNPLDAVPDTLPRFVVITLSPTLTVPEAAITGQAAPPPPMAMLCLTDSEEQVMASVMLSIRSFYAYGGYFDLDDATVTRRVGRITVNAEGTGYQPPEVPDRLIPMIPAVPLRRVRFRQFGPTDQQAISPDRVFRVVAVISQVNGPRRITIEDEHHVMHVTDAVLAPLEDALPN